MQHTTVIVPSVIKKVVRICIIEPENFTSIEDKEFLTSYTFNTKTAKHTFCSICGIYLFDRLRSHPDKIDVNIHNLDLNLTDLFNLEFFDGRNWENNIEQIQD